MVVSSFGRHARAVRGSEAAWNTPPMPRVLVFCTCEKAWKFPLHTTLRSDKIMKYCLFVLPLFVSGYHATSTRRMALRTTGAAAVSMSGGFFSNIFGSPAVAAPPPLKPKGKGGATNEIVGVVDGILQKRLGGGDIIVSEMGLGTQRWGSADFNAPDEAMCHKMMDRAILNSGINLIDTAEQYPIPSDFARPEGNTERIIGSWLKQDQSRRSKVVIASKITGGRNVNARNIVADCEGSLGRLGTDYLDVYLLHWPARYTPQSNWGQSLEYNPNMELYSTGRASFEEIADAMSGLVKAGKIRGWGMCNDNAFGLTASAYAARGLGGTPPICMQNDYSIINRRIEENGLSEASSPVHENCGRSKRARAMQASAHHGALPSPHRCMRTAASWHTMRLRGACSRASTSTCRRPSTRSTKPTRSSYSRSLVGAWTKGAGARLSTGIGPGQRPRRRARMRSWRRPTASLWPSSACAGAARARRSPRRCLGTPPWRS